MKDFHGRELYVGAICLRACAHKNSPYLEEQLVTRIEGGKVYMNGSHIAMRFTDKLFIIGTSVECKVL